MLLKVDGYITNRWIDARHKIDYQFSKLINEKGTVIFSNSDDFSASGLYNFYAERALLYNTVSKHKKVKNIAKCFILSMPPGEYPSEETFTKIGEKMLEKMGYSECPRVMFQHHDTDKAHMHILVSTITDGLVHVDNTDDYERCFHIGRELEKEFGFSELKKNAFSKLSFQEVASRRYYFQNALQKALRKDQSGKFTSLFDSDTRQRILRQSLTNQHMIELLGEDTYERVGEMLKGENMFHKFFKSELVDRLELIYQHSQGDDFLKYAKDQGIYVRHVKDMLIYGLSDLSFYLNENSLPRKFHYKTLKESRTAFKLDSEQQQYIFESFCNSCYGTPIAFLKRLNEHKILAKDTDGRLLFITKDMDGNFGDYSFMDTTVPDAQWFKGKDLSKKLAGMNLKDILDNKYAHEYKLSDTFRQLGQVHDDMFSKALKKAVKSHAVQERLHLLIPDDVQGYMNQYSLDKSHYRILMNESSFRAVNDILYKGGFFHSFYMDSLKKVLDAIFVQANGDRSMFLLLAEEKSIKVHLLKNRTFMYEIKGSEGIFRFKENRLPQKFRNALLMTKQQANIYKLQEEQYTYVFNSVRDSFKEAIMLKDIFTRLSDQHISVFNENKQIINEKNGSDILFRQCLFVDQSSVNPVFITGASMLQSLSDKSLSDIVSGKMSAGSIHADFVPGNHPSMCNFAPVHSHGTTDEDFVKRKKKKRGIGDISMND
jgi:hypothetical protein